MEIEVNMMIGCHSEEVRSEMRWCSVLAPATIRQLLECTFCHALLKVRLVYFMASIYPSMLSVLMGNFSSPGKLKGKGSRRSNSTNQTAGDEHDLQRYSVQRQMLVPHLECGYRVDSSDTADEAE